MTSFSPEYEDILQKTMRLSGEERKNLGAMLMLISLSHAYEGVLQKVMELSIEERQDLETLLKYYDLAVWGQSHKDLQQAPLPPAEAIAEGLTGTWSDLDIRDSTEWINDQKIKRQAENRW